MTESSEGVLCVNAEYKVMLQWLFRVRRMQSAYYDAGRWYSRWHTILGCTAIGFSTVAGTALVYKWQTSPNEWFTFIAGLIGVLAAIFTSLHAFLKYSELAEKHRSAGDGFAHLKHEIELLLTYPPAKEGALAKSLTRLEKKWDTLRTNSPSVSGWEKIASKEDWEKFEKDYDHLIPLWQSNFQKTEKQK
jgi:hypothetical protein